MRLYSFDILGLTTDDSRFPAESAIWADQRVAKATAQSNPRLFSRILPLVVAHWKCLARAAASLARFALQWVADSDWVCGEEELNHRFHRYFAQTPFSGLFASRTRAAWILAGFCVAWFGIASLALAHGAQSSASSSAKLGPSAKAAAPAKPIAPVALPAPVKSYGSSSAPIKMEVFTDYQCPSCRNLFENTLRPMIVDYVATGKVYLVHHDFPLPAHMYGYEAARWVNAAARVGQFQNVEAALYDHQDSWQADGSIEKYVESAVPAADFKKIQKLMVGCEYQGPASTKSASFKADAQANHGCALDTYIEQDRALGMKIPVQATPTYVITYKGQKLPAGSGVVSWPILKQFFDSLLSQ